MDAILKLLQEVEAERDVLRAEREAFNAMANLLATDNAFANHVKGGGIGFNVMCSDTFAYACADCENIDISQAPEVWKLYQDGGWHAVVRWVQEKRGDERFIKPVEEEVRRSEAIRAERDKLAESERSWQELASARGVALKALVEAVDAIREGASTYIDIEDNDVTESEWSDEQDQALSAAIAKAREVTK